MSPDVSPAASWAPAQAWWHIALAAACRPEPELEEAEVAALGIAKAADAIGRASAAERWQGLEQVLMAPHPSHGLRAWRIGRLLGRLLPEVEALFGVPQLSDAAESIDIGWHQLAMLDEAAKAGAPLQVRFAALAHKIGKATTPRDIWPSHYKHEQRAHQALDRWADWLAPPADALDLARLVIDEADRVHRVSDIRAGPVAAMLERLQALELPDRFEQLLQVCTCDWAAHAGHSAEAYPKATKLRRALAAYQATPVQGLDADAALQARAQAIAEELRPSVRSRTMS